jgi:hypothetical protein
MCQFVGSWILLHGAVSRAIMALFLILAHVAIPENSLIATGCNKRGFTVYHVFDVIPFGFQISLVKKAQSILD